MSVFYSKKTSSAGAAGAEVQAAAAQVFNFNQPLPYKEAILKVKELSKEREFKESVEAIIRLNVDPR